MRHRGIGRVALVGALIALGAIASGARAQEPTYDLRVERSSARKVVVELLPLEVVSTRPEAVEGAQALATRLVADLVYSGLLALKSPLPQGARLPADAPRNSLAGEEEELASATLRLVLEGERPEQMRWLGTLTEPRGRTLLLGKRYVVDLADLGRPVHHLADAIVQELTGEPGIAQTRVIFSRGDGERRELYLVDYDGENLRRVTRNRSLNLAPRWSPDGSRICYTSYFRGRQRLLILDGATGRSTKIAEFSGLNVGAAWAPGGAELAVTLSRDGNPEIYRINPEGEVQQRLSFEASIECSPCWDPTGRQIAFTSDRTGVPQIYVMDREGANRRRLSYEGRYNESAAWSPRGDRIAYVSRLRGRFQVFTVDPDGSNVEQITFPGDGNNEDPSWAPDGRHLVVSSDRGGTRELWILDVVAGDARRLTRGDVDDTSPHWGPRPAAPATPDP